MSVENIPSKHEDPTNPTIMDFLRFMKLFKEEGENVAPAVQAFKAKLKEIGKHKSFTGLYKQWLASNPIDLRGKESFRENLAQYVKAGVLSDQDVRDIYEYLIP